MEAVGSKSLGRKRAANDVEVKAPRKRQKTTSAQDILAKSQLVEDKPQVPENREEDQVFRFLDLPGGSFKLL